MMDQKYFILHSALCVETALLTDANDVLVRDSYLFIASSSTSSTVLAGYSFSHFDKF